MEQVRQRKDKQVEQAGGVGGAGGASKVEHLRAGRTQARVEPSRAFSLPAAILHLLKKVNQA